MYPIEYGIELTTEARPDVPLTKNISVVFLCHFSLHVKFVVRCGSSKIPLVSFHDGLIDDKPLVKSSVCRLWSHRATTLIFLLGSVTFGLRKTMVGWFHMVIMPENTSASIWLLKRKPVTPGMLYGNTSVLKIQYTFYRYQCDTSRMFVEKVFCSSIILIFMKELLFQTGGPFLLLTH